MKIPDRSESKTHNPRIRSDQTGNDPSLRFRQQSVMKWDPNDGIVRNERMSPPVRLRTEKKCKFCERLLGISKNSFTFALQTGD